MLCICTHMCTCVQAFASLPGKHAVLQETSAQHFPQAAFLPVISIYASTVYAHPM